MTAAVTPLITVDGLTMAFGTKVVQRDVSFRVMPRSIFVIMGGSGCGKSTLLKHLIGLIRPADGRIFYGGTDFWALPDDGRDEVLRRFGVLFQGGALWSSMTVAENVALPLQMFSPLSPPAIRDLVRYKLALVGLDGAADLMPSQISGGMKKRAGLARALAFDPELLFLDEPSAGLDPISSRRLDDLILKLRDQLGVSVVIVTHELDSIFAIGDDSVFLDATAKTAIAHGNPQALRDDSDNSFVRSFLARRDPDTAPPSGKDAQ